MQFLLEKGCNFQSDNYRLTDISVEVSEKAITIQTKGSFAVILC